MRHPSLFLPLALIIIGAVWFLRTTNILPPTAILLAIALVAGGVLVLLFDGINKQSVVSGPFLIYCGAAVYCYSQMIMAASPLIALGMVVLGLLLLLSRSGLIPTKKYPAPVMNARDTDVHNVHEE